MAESPWNWETKVDRLRELLEKHALECTFDIGSSTVASDLNTVRSVTEVSEAAESNWSQSSVNVSEHLINYSTFNDEASVTIEHSIFEGYQVSSADSVITKTSVDQDSVNRICEVATIYEPICVTSASHANNGNNPIENKKIQINISHKPIPSNHIKSNEVLIKDHRRSKSAPNIDLQMHPERMTNWIPLLEMAKLNISKLIDDHIVAIRNKANLLQSRQDEWLEKFRSLQAQKTTERRVCIQNMRDELNTKMENINHLLERLEKI